MRDFLEKLAEILEADPAELTADFKFRSVPEWGSLMGFSILILLQDEYGKTLTPGALARLETVGELAGVALGRSLDS